MQFTSENYISAASKEISVVHVSEAFGGGVQTAIYAVVQATPQHGHSLFVRARADQPTHTNWRQIPVNLVEKSLPTFIIESLAFVWKKKPDVLHLHSSFAGVLRLFPLPMQTRVVYQPHCFAFERLDLKFGARRLAWLAEKLLSFRAQRVIAVSPHEKDLALRLNPKATVVTVPNPGSMSAMPVSESANRAVVRSGEVMMTGRISAQKGPEIFAAIAAQLSTEPLTFTWIGDGDPDSKALLRSAGVEVTGWLSPQHVTERLRDVGLYLHCARWEGAPLAAIEAASAGIPVIAFDIASMRSLGYEVSGPTSSDLARSAKRFFTDETYRAKVRRATSSVARENNWDSMKLKLGEAYLAH